MYYNVVTQLSANTTSIWEFLLIYLQHFCALPFIRLRASRLRWSEKNRNTPRYDIEKIILQVLRDETKSDTKSSIPDFCVQEPRSAIILGILLSFLHFLKAYDINSWLQILHRKQFPIQTRENIFPSKLRDIKR